MHVCPGCGFSGPHKRISEYLGVCRCGQYLNRKDDISIFSFMACSRSDEIKSHIGEAQEILEVIDAVLMKKIREKDEINRMLENSMISAYSYMKRYRELAGEIEKCLRDRDISGGVQCKEKSISQHSVL